MLERKIYKKILDFYSLNTHKALMITGARQVGKSFIIDKFGSTYQSFIKIDFINNPEHIDIFNKIKSSDDVLLRIQTLFGKKLIPNKTLIFFDEVQECKEIITQIKYLILEGSYTYILSGSLLGTIFNDVKSIPVGYLEIIQMYPLDFEEFARANGIIDKVFEKLEYSFNNKIPVDEFIHKRFLELFDLYLIIGGMPSCVDTYLKTKNLYNVTENQKSIIELYKKDISKYDKEEKLYLEDIYDLIPSELNNKNKRFILKDLNEYTKFKKFANSFLWLKYAGVALPTYTANELKSPLILSKSTNLFKLYLNDIGLLCAIYGSGLQLKILNHETNMNFGSIYENIAAQELKAHNFDLYYYNSKKNGEIDFVIENNGEIIPIEIKSGKDYIRHQALNNILDSNTEINQGFVFCHDNISHSGKVTYFPIYMLMFIHKEELPKDIVFNANFEDLNNIV